MPMTSFLADSLLNAAKSGGSVNVFSGGMWLALLNDNPGPGGGVAQEITGTSYNRKSVAGSFATAANGYMVNNLTVSFDTAGGSWGRPQFLAIYTAITAGTMLWYGAIAAPVTVNPGDVVHFHPGSLTLTNRLV